MLRSCSVCLLLIATATAAVAGDWTETVTVKGDMRYRHEMIDAEGKESRTRHRIRARVALDAALDEDLSVHFRFASGSDDPVSTNQSLDGAFTTKGFGLDRAYFAWKHADSGVKVTGGKIKNPFYAPAKTELLWDGDLNPEGASVHLVTDGATRVFFNAAGLFVDERSGSSGNAKNASLMGGQAGLVTRGDGYWITVGGGAFRYANLDGALFMDDDEGVFFGNTSVDDGFASGFQLIEAFVELGFDAGGTPVVVFADFVTNNDADDHEQGYLFGAKLNKTKAPGSWDARWTYREVQADAVMGAFTDSDFIGGGTDGKGHEINVGYQFATKAKLGLSYFINKKGLDDSVDYNRFMADLKFKF